MSDRSDDYIVQTRLAKLKRLRERGVDPYPPRAKRTHTAQQAIAAYERWERMGAVAGDPAVVAVAGRITALRTMGRASFLDLRDGTGKIQVYLRRDVLGEAAYEGLRDLDLGDFLSAEGHLFRTKSGEITVEARAYSVLAKALRPLPEKWHGLKDIETRYRQRYLDMIANEQVRRLFVTRSRIVSAIRHFLDNRGFIEVETPVLQSQAGGAAARPFVTYHNALEQELYLRIALELHLKRLIVGGLDKVYEIGRVFRNEGVTARHNPEYTMLETYEAYADYNDVARMVEEMVSYVAQDVMGTNVIHHPLGDIDLTPPWRRLTMREALIQYAGLDYEEYRDPDALRSKALQMHVDVPASAGWGKVLDELVSLLVQPKLIQPTFLMDYPTELSPLAKRKLDDPTLVERFEPFACGMEFGNAYSELNDPIDQRRRFEEQLRLRQAGDEETEPMDEDFLTAIEHGLPPTGGLGIGIDRLVMILTGQTSIREVILFPALRRRE